jgi:hypothetical protein
MSLEVFSDEVRYFVDVFNDAGLEQRIDARTVLGTTVILNGRCMVCSPNYVWKLLKFEGKKEEQGLSGASIDDKFCPTIGSEVIKLMSRFFGSITKHLSVSECEENTTVQLTETRPGVKFTYLCHFTKLFQQRQQGTFVVDKCMVCAKECKQVCSGCFTVRYCSGQCQTSDWQSHKKVCKAFDKNRRNIAHRHTRSEDTE